ncbi:hypothetical protein CEXT_563721 [Caerostris extrusa]|uniref:Uncharacterized protein n=1 Tax=Caerostris extrusa TaxID=172846 RepID=A0AAV4T7G5_CAEEX|nr:hypothetical protein CEXT_563721 [Caerostris extrusa]
MFVVVHKLNFKTSEKLRSVPFIKSYPSFGISITPSERKQLFRHAVGRNSSFTNEKKGYPIKDKRGSILDAEGYVLEGRLLACSTSAKKGAEHSGESRYRVEMKWIANADVVEFNCLENSLFWSEFLFLK